MLSLKQVNDVCLQGQGADQCRYLGYDQSTGATICLKKVQARKDAIDAQVKKYVDGAKQRGQDPAMMGRAIGDNCKGYPALLSVVQGYDQP